MLEKMRTVCNPLTLIAFFAALAEAFSCLALPRLSPDVQHTFIWFVIAFPLVLVILFFATLNWNHRVLYAPSDYSDEENFFRPIGLTDAEKGTTGHAKMSRVSGRDHPPEMDRQFRRIHDLVIIKLRPVYESMGFLVSEHVKFVRADESVAFDGVVEEPQCRHNRLIDIMWVPDPHRNPKNYRTLLEDQIDKGEKYMRLTKHSASIVSVLVVPDKTATDFHKLDQWHIKRVPGLGREGWVFSYDEIGFTDKEQQGSPTSA